MPFPLATFLLLFLPLALLTSPNSSLPELDPVRLAQAGFREARTGIADLKRRPFGHRNLQAALGDCATLYEEADWRLAGMLVGENYTAEDAWMWLSAAVANHRSCLDGLEEVGAATAVDGNNLTVLLTGALRLYHKIAAVEKRIGWEVVEKRKWRENRGINLAKWNPATSKADYVVAKDGSGTHTTINGAVVALTRTGRRRRGERIVIYVKAGVYKENVEIGIQLKNIMVVGDGADKTMVIGSRNVPDGATTYNSATFGVSGDGFWARDITFENIAGPEKQQAVALRLNSDLAVVYRCVIKGYQDTLFLHSLRQFYRDCQIYGTVDFIFGNSAAVLQNCEIFVRRPIRHQANMITAQGRDDPAEATGISIIDSRVRPAPDFAPVKAQYRTYLGRPWKRFSRTVVIATDLDGLIDPKGWAEWRGDFAVSTLFYAEFKNRGGGSSTRFRVSWPGFHVLRSAEEARPFTVTEFLHGGAWIPATGVPFEAGV
ncbi:probable pectinesterase/pectinesterase inhibitor 36 [Benincasa hispida]|uniref:probable pectinesterase/pectinesterase inhibitor 36 n=1 Tax=Benincasa hispida TaxID=102211 RepID=UPI0018FFFF26|nr:probable pectinesterase/pectinesterase inhibitor 36 [Benincasa hispida]